MTPERTGSTVRRTMNVVGLDLSSRKLAIVGDFSGTYRYMSCDLGQKLPEATEEARQIVRRWMRRVTTSLDCHAFVEQPVVGVGGVQTTLKQSYVNGAVQAALVSEKYRVHPLVSNSHWKKEVLGNGRADKDQITGWIRDNWRGLYRVIGDDQDVMDSACILIYGLNELRRSA